VGGYKAKCRGVERSLDPGDLDEPNVEEAEEALSLARETVEAILALLPPEVQP